MERYAGLEVSAKETSVCIIDAAGKVMREIKVATEPEALRAVLLDDTFTIERIGLEDGRTSMPRCFGPLPLLCRRLDGTETFVINLARGMAARLEASDFRE